MRPTRTDESPAWPPSRPTGSRPAATSCAPSRGRAPRRTSRGRPSPSCRNQTMMRIRPRAPQAALALAVLFTSGIAGQQAPAPAAGGDQPAFRTGAELVIVDAVVVD